MSDMLTHEDLEDLIKYIKEMPLSRGYGFYLDEYYCTKEELNHLVDMNGGYYQILFSQDPLQSPRWMYKKDNLIYEGILLSEKAGSLGITSICLEEDEALTNIEELI